MTEVLDIESLAVEAKQWDVIDPTKRIDVGAMLQRVGQLPIWYHELVKCGACRGTGRDLVSRWAALWGYSCWICSGWGSYIKAEGPRFLGPVAHHPFRR